MEIVGYFQFDDDDTTVGVVLKSFWDQNHVLCDSGSEEPYMPAGFEEIGSAVYAYDYDNVQDAKDALIAAGFVEKKLF